MIEYLLGTQYLAITFDGLQTTLPKQAFLASSDASFGNDVQTRKSHQGYIFQLFGGPVDWSATKQRTVTTSSTEAELLALSTTAKETIWWKRFFQEITFGPGHQITIQCDNRQTIRLLEEQASQLTTKLRHVDIHHHWLRQEVRASQIQIHWTPSAEILADGLTKQLLGQRIKQFVKQLNLSDIKSLLA